MRINLNILALLIILLSSCTPRPDPNLFYSGRQNFLNQNYVVAREQLMGPARAGNPEAQYAIGYMYLNGLGTPEDEKMGFKWIRLSAKTGYYPAQEALGILELRHKNRHNKHSPHWEKQYYDIQNAKSNLTQNETLIEQPANEEVVTYAATTTPKPTINQQTPSIAKESSFQTQTTSLMNLPSSSYTIQIMGSHHLKNIKHFIKANKLENESYYYQTQKDGKNWYSLLYGIYPTQNQAKQTLSALPASLKSLHPWVKSMKQVHHEIPGVL